MEKNLTDKVMALAKRRGFFWQAYEPYGGVGGFYVLGDLGVRLKENIVNLWRNMFLKPYGFIEIESPTIAPYAVFEASGHVSSFKDAMAECQKCNNKYRADHLLTEQGINVSESTKLEVLEELLNQNKIRCLECGQSSWKVSAFITMFQTNIGPYKENIGFLRPETAQGMFVEFKQIYESNRAKMPVGIAQIGRAYRNEISPRQGLIRLREFSQIELEFFFNPLEGQCQPLEQVEDVKMNLLDETKVMRGEEVPDIVSAKEAIQKGLVKQPWLAFFMALSQKFMNELGVKPEAQRFRAKLEGERAHYSAQTYDQEVFVEKYGWIEVAGHAYRQDYDLKSHTLRGRVDMHVVEELNTPVKVKAMLAYLDASKIKNDFKEKASEIFRRASKIDPKTLAQKLQREDRIDFEGLTIGREYFTFKEVEETISSTRYIPHVVEPSFGIERIIISILEHSYIEKEDRIVLSLSEKIAPYKYAVFPLVKKDGLDKKAIEIYDAIKAKGLTAIYDDDGSIGRRYARVDEIGIPKAITVDYQTLEDDTVTVRDRDTWKQIRVKTQDLIRTSDNL
ncbi:MAG: glycine--tRNA ligase [Nitrososphaeria archaeon]